MQSAQTSHKEISNVNSLVFWACFSLYFSHWIGVQLSAVIFLGMLYGALLVKLHSGRIRRKLLFLGYFICGYSLLVIVIQTPSLQELAKWSPVGTPRLLFQATSMFLVFAFVNLLNPLSDDKLCRFLKFSYNLFALTIVIEWLLVNVVGISNSMMPAAFDSPSYLGAIGSFYRPFGLTGNAPVNGALLVTALWILLSCDKTISATRYVILTGLVLYLNNSGQEFAVFFFSVSYYCFTKTRGIGRYLLMTLLVSCFGSIVFSGIIDKISYDYILYMLRFLGLNSIGMMAHWRQIFGGYGKYSWLFEDRTNMTEFYPIYTITHFGFLLTVVTWLFIYISLPKKNKGLIFLTLLVGSIHYPMILFVEAQVLVGVYFFLAPKNQPAVLQPAAVSAS